MFIKKISFNFKIFISFQTGFHTYSAQIFNKDDGNFTADLQNVSFMSHDESIGKIEVDPKEEASVVEVFQEVLDKLSDVGKKDKLLKFFKLVQDGKFPLNNIVFQLFLDIAEWFDKDESSQMRYSPSIL